MGNATHSSLPEAFTTFLSGDDVEGLRDPYALYDRIRETEPVLRVGDETVLLTRYADVKAARTDRRIQSPDERLTKIDGRFSRLGPDDLKAYQEVSDFERLFLSRHDGERHRAYRRALAGAFTPRRMAEWPDRVQEIVDAELDAVVADGVVDLLQFAYRVPLLVIMELVGAPAEDAERVKHWGDALIESIMRVPLDPELLQLGHRRLDEYREYAAGLFERHRAADASATSVVAVLLAAQDTALTREHIVATFMHFLFAGHETTTNLIGNGVLALLANRDQWDLLRSDPSAYSPGAVEESLRYDAPSQLSVRVAVEDLEIGGVPVSKGMSIVLGNSPANRDPEMFPDPHRFDITRKPNDHMSFGWGPHFCLGSPLARLEGRAALETLVRRFPEMELAIDPADAEWVPRPRLRGLQRLPVRLGPDHGA